MLYRRGWRRRRAKRPRHVRPRPHVPWMIVACRRQGMGGSHGEAALHAMLLMHGLRHGGHRHGAHAQGALQAHRMRGGVACGRRCGRVVHR